MLEEREPTIMDAIRAQQTFKRAFRLKNRVTNPKHEHAIQLMREGMPMGEICKSIQISPNTLQGLKEFV